LAHIEVFDIEKVFLQEDKELEQIHVPEKVKEKRLLVRKKHHLRNKV